MCQTPDLRGLLTREVVDGFMYLVQQLDSYEKAQRYDDNARQMLENALRLYESGQMTKEQLKQVIDILPQKPIDVTPVQQVTGSVFDMLRMFT